MTVRKKLDVTLFSDLYRQVRAGTKRRSLLLYRGKVQSRDGRLQMIAQEIREAVAETFLDSGKNQ